MKDKICGIYMIRNLVNNKIYIGKSKDIIRRWYEHKSDLRCQRHDNCYLQNSWNKYGENCFEFNIIEQCLNEENLDEREKFYIHLYKSDDKNFGYNLTTGGDGGSPLSEAIKHMKVATRERYNKEGKAVYCPELNCTFSCPIEAQEKTGVSRQSISGCCRGGKNRKTAGVHPITGERLHWFFASDMKKINDFVQGNFQNRHSSLWKKVICVELNETFDSIKAASDKTGICASNITMCCSGKIQSAGRHPITGEKLHWKYTDEINNSSVA